MMTRLLFAAMAGLGFASGGALAHGDAAHAKKAERKTAKHSEERVYGREGNPNAVARTIQITGTDRMRYTPSVIRVKQGETVRLVMMNGGKLMHETVLGTRKELEEHYALMKKFPEMEHDEPNMIHVKPGETGDMIWQFTRPGEFEFACLIPGHWEAGMHGKVIVSKN
jgi:uncharacterized cupredoxin-like copper-binding protein